MLACPCCSEKLLTGKERTGRYGPSRNQGPISPALSKRRLRKCARKIILSFLHVLPSAAGRLGAGRACLEVFICLAGTVVSSSLTERRNMLVTAKCMDFVEYLRRNVSFKGHMSPSPVSISTAIESSPFLWLETHSSLT